MVSHLFYLYGDICTKFPWEVIVLTITLTTCTFTINRNPDLDTQKNISFLCSLQDDSITDMTIMTIIRCLAILYSYYQFRNIKRLGSKYVSCVALLFTLFSTLAFMSTILNMLQINFTDLKDALFLYLLLIDLSKVSMLARLALCSSNKSEIGNNIAKGLAMLGPKITLDTIVETLIIGIGTLSGVPRLEILSYFACISVIINYLVFMTFYLSCLSLILELSRKTKVNGKDIMYTKTFLAYSGKMNPVTQKVKIIMAIGLLLVHVNSKWTMNTSSIPVKLSRSDYMLNYSQSIRWFKICTDHGVALIILFVLIVKFIFTEMHDDFFEEMHLKYNINEVTTKNIKIQASDSCSSGEVHRSNNAKLETLTDNEVVELILKEDISMHKLEEFLNDAKRAVVIRRKLLSPQLSKTKHNDIFNTLPIENFDYKKLIGACCENVIGYVPIPLGIAGPLKLDDRIYHIPMATTEGCLIASVTRGCKAISSNGVNSRIVNDGMTRGPVVRFPTANQAAEAINWIQEVKNFNLLKEKFDSTSNYARLTKVNTRIAGRYLFIRFIAKTGDAMGMNMLSKGTEASLKYMKGFYPNMELLSLSGNFCSDKKPAYVNWLEGRGKSVICEAIIPSYIMTSLLKTSVQAIVDVNISKNLIGSSMAGCIGGYNAHSANVVTAIFIATGQDPAQNVVSSNCITLMEPWGDNGEDLYISCTMPSIEVGTVGGGTILPAQSTCLDMLGVKGGNVENPGENASQLARIVSATVLAGELSLLAALSAGHLVESHLTHNRSVN